MSDEKQKQSFYSRIFVINYYLIVGQQVSIEVKAKEWSETVCEQFDVLIELKFRFR